MKSRTKVTINDATIKKLFEKAGIPDAENISPLGAGEFNAVYSVDAGGQHYAIKIAPKKDDKILTYEEGMIEQEVYYYGLMEEAGIRVPEIFSADFSRTDIPTEYFIMERLGGKTIDQAGLTNKEWPMINAKVAAMTAQMHAVKGEQFGYRQLGLHDTWYQALVGMVEQLIADGKKLGHRSMHGLRLLAYINQHRDLLEKVECRLINFDIWPMNIICEKVDGEFQLAWIDPERCLWGDRIADFVCLDFMNMGLDNKTDALEAYNAATDSPIEITDEERIRYAIMVGYLALIMEVEKFARYNVFLKGWWRNFGASKFYFNFCFKQLSTLSSPVK
ncbi:MAG: aminoglycoside phosphotransferase family protein [Anaerolineae bacterium]|jgi:fructosamine-3-kinase|nr:aminoglycoside phosphotransferase family protein [Anaerolineae bacterium]